MLMDAPPLLFLPASALAFVDGGILCLSSAFFSHSSFPQSPSALLEPEGNYKESLIHSLPFGGLASIGVTSEMPSWETFKTEKYLPLLHLTVGAGRLQHLNTHSCQSTS